MKAPWEVGIGQRFGLLATIEPRMSGHQRAHLCRCDCGNEKVVTNAKLRTGHTVSCGCHRRAALAKQAQSVRVHGLSAAPEHRVWATMLSRCFNKNTHAYRWYGARGIKVCDRWRFGEEGKSGFECFIADMGMRPRPDLTIERKENNGDYEPKNCIWATWEIQRSNKRRRGCVAA